MDCIVLLSHGEGTKVLMSGNFGEAEYRLPTIRIKLSLITIHLEVAETRVKCLRESTPCENERPKCDEILYRSSVRHG